MSSSDRRRVILSLAALAGLAGCGYEPVLAPSGPGAGIVGRVAIEAPRNRYDFALVEADVALLLGGAVTAPEGGAEDRLDVAGEVEGGGGLEGGGGRKITWREER